MTSMHRVLIVAEGPSEIGGLNALSGFSRTSGRNSPPVVEGYIPPMLRKLLDTAVAIEAQRVTRIGRFETPLKGHADRAAKALVIAATSGYSLLVFVKDVDRQPGKKKSARERKKKLSAMHAEIEKGFGRVKDASDVVRVKATPCRMIEAWALGDADAVATVGGRGANRAEVPARPEGIWGAEDDPKSLHPKCALRRALGREADAKALQDLASEAQPEVLKQTCPESFMPFAREVAAAADALRTNAPRLPPPKSRQGR